MTDLLKMPLNVGLQAKCSRLWEIGIAESISCENLLPGVGLMYLLRMCRHYRHKSRQKLCRAPKMTAPIYQNGCDEFKYDVRF